MSGICSAHRGFVAGCPLCEAKCNTCTYKVDYPTDGGWCYMFKDRVSDCWKWIRGRKEGKEDGIQ